MKPKVRVVGLVGDSIVAEMNRLHLDDFEALSPDHVLLNLGVSGSRADDLTRRAPVLASLGLDVVILSVGLNDAAAPEARSPEEFQQVVTALVRELGSQVVIFKPPTTNADVTTGVVAGINPILRAYRSALDELVDEHQWGVVDPDLVRRAEPEVGRRPDGVHLTPDAYDALVPVLSQAVIRIRVEG